MSVSENVQNEASEVARGDGVVLGLRFRKIFPGVAKPLIAMAHVPALPGTPLYRASDGVRGLVTRVREDVALLVDAGFDAVMFCNENDRPYALKGDLVASAVMARVVIESAPTTIPYGVDYLWDPECALAAAVAADAGFIREVATGSWESDMGTWSPDVAALLRRRRALDADGIAVFMNITPEFASTTGRRSPAEIARSVAVSSLADAILVSGPMAGDEPEVSTLAEVRAAVPPGVPVLLNTGAKAENVAEFLEHADGCIVGSSLKEDGYTWNRVDPVRAKAFVHAARS
ncbi:MAG TPA: BtpA/SgcQ family protein [Acidimicrobiales bacterium]|nr:BtpA/SgcQ family protein [Acidimicrobiales bacterium]